MILVLIPTAVIHLDEPHAGLGEAPRQQALAAEVGWPCRCPTDRLLARRDSAPAWPAIRVLRSSRPGAAACMRKPSSIDWITPSSCSSSGRCD